MTRIISDCNPEKKVTSKVTSEYSLTRKLLKHNCFCFSRCGNWDVGNLSNAHSAHIKPKMRSQNVWVPPCLNSYRQLLTYPPLCKPEVPTKNHHMEAQTKMYNCLLLVNYLFIGITVNNKYEKRSKSIIADFFNFFCTIAGFCQVRKFHFCRVKFFCKAVSTHGVTMMYNYK